ncbi:hypothetical protein E2320_000292 [Naja naja]|nr:hypothetical protein E2320_000292 [Naja naja]
MEQQPGTSEGATGPMQGEVCETHRYALEAEVAAAEAAQAEIRSGTRPKELTLWPDPANRTSDR